MVGRIGKLVITGANGNLGGKLVQAFAAANWCESIVALDYLATPRPTSESKVTSIQGDLTDGSDARWIDALVGADSIIHLAARNPQPDATWDEAAMSLAMTTNLLLQAWRKGVRRFVFASSNHVMGGYKDRDDVEPGGLTSERAPMPGTRVSRLDGDDQLSTPYSVAKLMGEVICKQAAVASAGRLTTACLRIGWCQPGENRPETLSAAGVANAGATAPHPDEARDLAWFQNMWLSNADLIRVMKCALLADASAWPGPAIVVNAMSNNSRMAWDISLTRELLGYAPEDDVRRALADDRNE